VRQGLRFRPSWPGGATLLVLALVLVLAGIPIWSILENAFRNGTPYAPGGFTFDHVIQFFTGSIYQAALLNTAIVALVSLVVAVPLGFLLAWLAARTDVPGRRLMQIGNVVPYLFPTFLGAIGWAYLAQPRTGLLNVVLGFINAPNGPFDVNSQGGIGVVMGIFLAPITYLICSGALSSMNGQLEEAGHVFGFSQAKTLFRITIPMMRPAIVASAVLTVALSLEDFGVPQILGTPAHISVLMTQVYAQQVYSSPSFGPSGVIALLMLIVAALLGAYYRRSTRQSARYATITGKATRPTVLHLGVWRYPALIAWIVYFLISCVLPFGTLLYISLRPFPGLGLALTTANYTTVLGDPTVQRSIGNSLLYSTIGAVVAVLLGLGISVIVLRRRPTLITRALDTIAVVPLTIPGVILGLSLVDFWSGSSLPVYGTVLMVIIIMVTRYFPLGQRTIMSSFTQLSGDLESAANVAGAPPLKAFAQITLPLIRNSLLAAFMLVWVLMFREIAAVLFVNSYGHELLSVMVLQDWSQGQFTWAAALAMVEAVVALLGLGLFALLSRGLTQRNALTGGH